MSSRYIVAALALAVLAPAAGCTSSSSAPPAPHTPAAHTPAASSAPAGSSQKYLTAVNGLCDKLLPKVVKVTHGGNIDVPARKYLASWPAHKRLLTQFDRDVAAVRVPPSARKKAATLAAYVTFADRLDAARLTAAHRGQAAYAREVKAESNVGDDPAITELVAAGFNQSCTAR